MPVATSRSLTRAEIEDRIDTLPTLPTVVTEILGLDPVSDEFYLKLRELALRDPPFAVRILAVANSAMFSTVAPVVSIPDALIRLGARHTAQLITSLSVMRVFVPTTEGHRNLWRHAIQVAVAARAIACRRPGDVDPHLAYVAGLLHDIGRFVLFEHDPVDLDAVEKRHWMTPLELLAAERDVCGFDHTELGWRACQVWSVPEPIGVTVRLHHRRTFGAEIDPEQIALIRVVQQADVLSCLLLNQPELVRLDPSAREAAIRRAVTPVCEGDARAPSASELSMLAAPIVNECAELTAALGLRVH